MWKCICLALVAVFLLALILLLSFFSDVLSDRQRLLVESRLDNLMLTSDNIGLRRNLTSLRLGRKRLHPVGWSF
jgi:hypothetical protein